MKYRFILLGIFLFCLLNVPAVVHAAPSLQAIQPDQNISQSSHLQEFDKLFAEWNQESYSTVQNPGNALNEKVVYLTFDDGPDPNWTPKVLDLLARHNAKATFFMIGRNVVTEPQTVLQVAQAGQMIGNHSFNHLALSKLSWNDFFLELRDTDQAIRTALSQQPDLLDQVARCMRPPYGEANPNIYNYAYRMNYDVSFWSLDTMDWSGVSAEDILNTVMASVKPNAIILMHDGGKDRSETVQGLALVLHELLLQGYSFQPLCSTDGQVIKYP